MRFLSILSVGLLAHGSHAYVYDNNCKGSSRNPSLSDCQVALRNIDVNRTYRDQAQFSFGNCYMIYATNGSGDQTVSGQTLQNTAKSIMDTCANHKGSFGTENCHACHVTITYRAPKQLKRF
ncbi:hypothetical protein BJY04DRAFT_223615 [Aspergillus karnatakaensis]|uniref:uncharacterized protein n=1 Tax=Aspergillus karnatakaensis TaxID=1810916 RepID=UPI003CCDA9F0